MKNLFNKNDFEITDDYIQSSISAAAAPHSVYTVLTSHELPGELFVLVAEKNQFINEQQALISFMQRMVLLLVSENENLGTYDEEAIINLTKNFCTSGYYNELEYKEIPANYFKDEAEFLFKIFTENFDRKINEQESQYNQGIDGFFKNHLPVDRFEKTNPLEEELIQEAHSLVDYNDGKYFFAISEKNYILLNWQSGGPLHLLVKPSRRNPNSLLLSKDAVYDALRIKNGNE